MSNKKFAEVSSFAIGAEDLKEVHYWAKRMKLNSDQIPLENKLENATEIDTKVDFKIYMLDSEEPYSEVENSILVPTGTNYHLRFFIEE